MPADTDMGERFERVEAKGDQLQDALADDSLAQVKAAFARLGDRIMSIQRELRDHNAKMDDRFPDHARLMARHDRHLRALERLDRRQHPQTKP